MAALPCLWTLQTSPGNASSFMFPCLDMMSNLHLLRTWMKARYLQLASSAARIIMKCLWLARLARPDLMVAVTSLASKVASWSPNDDRRCARLIGYIAATPDYSPIMYINNKPSELRLALCVDSDFGGCIHTARSTSGYVLVVEGDQSLPSFLGLQSGRKLSAELPRKRSSCRYPSCRSEVGCCAKAP